MYRLFIILLFWAAATWAAGAALPADPSEAAAVRSELQDLDQSVQQWLIRAGRNAAEGHPLPHLADEAESLRQRLQAVEAEVHRLGLPELRPKVEQVRALVENLERAAAGPASAASPSHAVRRPAAVEGSASLDGGPVGLAPANDACANATTIGFGSWSGSTAEATLDGEASCGSALFTPDVWFRFEAPQNGTVYVDTFGSSYDTVVSVHDDCPGTIAGELTCNDDAFGLQSAASFWAGVGEVFWIRVSGVNGATGDYQLTVGAGGTVSGTVTEAGTGDPIGPYNCVLRTYDAAGFNVRSQDASGPYSVSGLVPATYTLRVQCYGDFYLGELYDDIPCHLSCDPTTGTPVEVSDGVTTSGIDFALSNGGSISGTVTEDGTGVPISGVRVRAWNSSGSAVASGYTDAQGLYTIGRFRPANYTVTASGSDHAGELYDNQPCSPNCNVRNGMLVPVAADTTVSGIDFSLKRLGRIRGQVIDTLTRDPIRFARARVYNSLGYYVSSGYTLSNGVYVVGGLPAGNYFVTVEDSDYVDELYQNIICPGGRYYNCYVKDGTPVPVTLDATTSGISFALRPLGQVNGTVTRAANGVPIPGARVELYRSSGSYWATYYTNSAGSYSFSRVLGITYYAAVEPGSWPYTNLLNEVYDGVLCQGPIPAACSPLSGTPIDVGLGETVIADFSLVSGGSVRGNVNEAVSGAPIGGATVKLWDGDGTLIRTTPTGTAGDYEFLRLTPGDVFATVDHDDYVGELYPDLPCFEGNCDPVTGWPITVQLGKATNGIDFALSRRGSISGKVTYKPTGDGLSEMTVRIYDTNGSQVRSATTDADGFYEVQGLAAGLYYARTYNYHNYQNQVFSGIECSGFCTPTLGTPINVKFGVRTENIDFALDRYGKISGTVYGADGAPLVYEAWVDLFDETGNWVDYSFDGYFSLTRLTAGTYYLIAADVYGYHAPEIYQETPCVAPCDPLAGTPVVVAMNEEVDGIDFTLEPYGAFSGVVTHAETGEPLAGVNVRVYSGNNVVRYGTSGTSGRFTVGGLSPGAPHTLTAAKNGFLGELYDGIPCLDGTTASCTPSKGKAVQAVANTTIRHLNFALAPFGGTGEPPPPAGIHGTVRDASGQPIAQVVVDLWRSNGNHWGSVVTGLDGTYSAHPYSGTYYLSTDGEGWINEVYDSVVCLNGPAFLGGCDPLLGTPVELPSYDSFVKGVDFFLDRATIFSDGFESGDTAAWSASQ